MSLLSSRVPYDPCLRIPMPTCWACIHVEDRYYPPASFVDFFEKIQSLGKNKRGIGFRTLLQPSDDGRRIQRRKRISRKIGSAPGIRG